MKRCDTFSAKRKLVISKSLSILKEIYRVNKNKPAVCVLTLSTVVADIQSPPKGGFPSYIFYVDSPARVEHCYYRFLQIPSKNIFCTSAYRPVTLAAGSTTWPCTSTPASGTGTSSSGECSDTTPPLPGKFRKKNQNMYFPNIFLGKKYLTGFWTLRPTTSPPWPAAALSTSRTQFSGPIPPHIPTNI